MSYLGDSLNDYYSHELIEKVIEQLRSNDEGNIGSIDKLKQNLKILNQEMKLKEPKKPRHKKCTSCDGEGIIGFGSMVEQKCTKCKGKGKIIV